MLKKYRNYIVVTNSNYTSKPVSRCVHYQVCSSSSTLANGSGNLVSQFDDKVLSSAHSRDDVAVG